MQQFKLDKNRNLGWMALMAFIVLLIMLILIWVKRSMPSEPSRPIQSQPIAEPIPSSSTPTPLSTPQEVLKNLNKQQTKAAVVVEQDPLIAPITSPVDKKPNFVSETEWQILTATAQTNSNPEQELTRLINLLRFNKQIELWQSIQKSDHNPKWHALANQLLNELPARVAGGEINEQEARKLKQELLEYLSKGD